MKPSCWNCFSNPDPLVREISLRGLRKIAGQRTTTALAQLLTDPEPNVRAAVLKQLAEKPTGTLASLIKDYLTREKDPDLVVHAARVLRGVTSKTAVDCLTGLLGHAQLAGTGRGDRGAGRDDFARCHAHSPLKVDIYAGIIETIARRRRLRRQPGRAGPAAGGASASH